MELDYTTHPKKQQQLNLPKMYVYTGWPFPQFWIYCSYKDCNSTVCDRLEWKREMKTMKAKNERNERQKERKKENLYVLPSRNGLTSSSFAWNIEYLSVSFPFHSVISCSVIIVLYMHTEYICVSVCALLYSCVHSFSTHSNTTESSINDLRMNRFGFYTLQIIRSFGSTANVSDCRKWGRSVQKQKATVCKIFAYVQFSSLSLPL